MKLGTAIVLAFFAFSAFATFVGVRAGHDFELGYIGPATVTPSSSDAAVYSQPYDFGALVNGYGVQSGGNYVGADDFTPAHSGTVNEIELWMIYTGAHPCDFNLFVYNDDSDTGHQPGSVHWSQTVPSSQVTDQDTGDDEWGYDIYHTTIYLGTDGFSVSAGTMYWLGVQTVGSDVSYWLVTDVTWAEPAMWSLDNGSTWQSPGADVECFFILNDDGTSLSPSTWGGIKSEF